MSENIFLKGTKHYTKGAIGSALSHLQLWEKCIELNKPIIIMEDDAIVSKNFNKNVDNLMNNLLPEKWDILLLNYNFDSVLSFNNTNFETCVSMFNQTKVTKEHIRNFIDSDVNATIAKLNYAFGISAYILHPDGAKILKKKCFPLCDIIVNNIPVLNSVSCFTVDCIMNSFYKQILAYVCIIPFVITPHISDDYKSLNV